jgi:hypothetical protein
MSHVFAGERRDFRHTPWKRHESRPLNEGALLRSDSDRRVVPRPGGRPPECAGRARPEPVVPSAVRR